MAACQTELCALNLSPSEEPEPSPFFASFLAPSSSPPAETGGPPSIPPPPPPTRRSSPPSPSPSPSPISTGAVIGLVIGGAAVLLFASTFLYFWLSKKRRGTPNLPSEDRNLPSPPPPVPLGDQYNDQQIYPVPAEKYMMPRPSPPDARTLISLKHPARPHTASIRTSSSSRSNYSGFEGQVHPPYHGKNMFTYEELHMATDGFSTVNFLGEGGFGYVHKGVLQDGKEVAVKSLKLGSIQEEREFQEEVEIISRVHHKHLVSLVGYCISGPQRMLVYDFVPNNTLEFHLHGMDQPTMDWPTRLKFPLGSAKGLAYLHEDCHPRIVHRDIKTANILLDFNFHAKVADFGLAKVCSDAYSHVTTRVMGTFGYLAPEYASSGKLTEKSDVYSFGVVLLELITGHRPIGSRHSYMDYSLVEWARPLLTEALEDNNFESLIDQRLQRNYNPNEMTRVVACAASCVRHSAHHRPQMSIYARVLEGEVSLADLDKGMMPAGNSPEKEYGGTPSEHDRSGTS